MSLPRRAALLRAALPVLAITVFAGVQVAILSAAGPTIGYDFLAYHAAARRVLDGIALYEFTFDQAGGFGLFLYPPTFLPLVLPFGLLDAATATTAWIGLMVAALLGGIRLLPVQPTLRWVILLMAGLSWPVAYTIKLGQVTPLLFLLMVIGWRGINQAQLLGVAHPGRGRLANIAVGASAALGAAIKIQPGLLLAWAALTRRWSAVAWGLLVLAVLAVVSLVVVGPTAWPDYVTLLRQITDPVTTAHNVTPGTVAHDLGLPTEVAAVLQAAVVAGALAAVVGAALRATAVSSYLVALSASQLASPVLWDHYAMLLLLPVAWLLAQRQRWAAVIPLATSLPLIWITPVVAYPLAFGLALAATLALGVRRKPRSTPLAESLSVA
jgi:hypothetical protein